MILGCVDAVDDEEMKSESNCLTLYNCIICCLTVTENKLLLNSLLFYRLVSNDTNR